MATYYIDNNRGNDSNDGLTKDTAWQNLSKIDDSVAAAGDKFLLADDSTWEYGLDVRVVPPTTWAGTEKNPVVIDKYNYNDVVTNNKPTIIWNKKIQSNEWTWDAVNNAWFYNVGLTVGTFCLVRLNNTWKANKIDNGLPLASVEGRWDQSGTTFYLWAPSDIDPTTYYGEVLISPNAGFFTLSTNRNWVTIKNILFKNTGTGVLCFCGGAGNTGVVVDGVDGITVSGLIRAATSGTTGTLQVEVKNCNIKDWGAVAIHGFSANSGCFKKLDLHDNTIIDGMHVYSQGAFYIQVKTTGHTTKIYNNKINGVNWGTPDKIFDGCGIYVETGSDNVDVYSNLVTNAYTAFQDNSGATSRWWSNVAIDCRGIMRVSDQEDVDGMNLLFTYNTCITGKAIPQKFGAGYTTSGIRVYRPSGNATFNITNNVFWSIQGDTDVAILTPQTTWSGNIDNNCFYGYSTLARREFSPFTVETTTNSIQTHPFLNTAGYPKSNSPLKEVGTTSFVPLDFYNRRRNLLPTVGAYEYQEERAVR